jgi:Retrotransposon gag protein
MELKELRQGQGDLEDYIAQFKILKGRCGITNDTALIEYFMDGLHPELLKKGFRKDNVPDTLDRWIEAASKFDGQWRRAKAIAGKAKTEKKMTPTPAPKAKEANTLDINRLSNQERAEHMRKGLCFICHQQGHRSSDHKNGNIPTPSFSPNRNENRYQPQKKSGTDTYAKIRALMAELDEEEKGKTLLLMEQSGF